MHYLRRHWLLDDDKATVLRAALYFYESAYFENAGQPLLLLRRRHAIFLRVMRQLT